MDKKQVNMLVKNAQKGDKQAFSALYRQFVGNIYAYYYVRLGARQDSEDLTSKVFMKALKGIKNFGQRSSFATWLYSISRNELMDFFRKKKITETFCEEKYFVSEDNEPQDISEKRLKKVEKTLAQLPEKYSQVLRLRFLQNLSIAETAQVMGISENNVKIRQLRALEKAKRGTDGEK